MLTMDRRQIFEATLEHRQTERVLVDYGKHIGSFHRRAYARLLAHLDDLALPIDPPILDRMAQNIVLPEVLAQRLGIDFRWLIPHWVGVEEVEVNGSAGYLDMWRTPHQYSELGDYYAIADQPLGSPELSLHDLHNIPWPRPDQPEMFVGLADPVFNTLITSSARMAYRLEYCIPLLNYADMTSSSLILPLTPLWRTPFSTASPS